MLVFVNAPQSGSNAYGTNEEDNLSCDLPTSQRPNGDVGDMMSQGSGSAPMSPTTNTGNIISDGETITEELSPALEPKDLKKQVQSLHSVSSERSSNRDIDQTDEKGSTSFYKAVTRGQLLKVINIVESGADPNKADEDGRKAPHVAAEEGHKDIVKFLVDQGAEVNAEDDLGQTALHAVMHNDQCISAEASGTGHLNIVKYLIEQGSKIYKQDHRGYTPLHIAAAKGHLEIVKYLTDQKCSVKEVDNAGLTPLSLAAKHGHLDTVKYLANGRVDDKCEVIDYLLTNGAKANQGKEESPLYMASRLGHLDAVKVLISRGISVNAESHRGQIPLYAASATGRIQVVKILIENGSDLNKTDIDGWTPLHLAVQNGHLEVVKYLMRKGAIDIKYRGMTSLYTAAQSGHLDIVDLFLSNGTDLNEEDDTGRIPFHAAAANGSLKIAGMLINHGSNVNKMADNGWTPLHAAVFGGRFSDINGESWYQMPSNFTDASFSLQDPRRTNPDSLSRQIKTTTRPPREPCVAQPKTQLYGGEVPPTDNLPITSEYYAVDSKAGIKNGRRNIENCSILTAIHRAIFALAFFFACTPVLVAGNVRWTEQVTLDVGTRGVVTFHLQPPSSTLQFSLFYTIQFGSKGRPFCIDGRYDVDGFKDPSQVSRFTATITDIDTPPGVDMTIDEVDTIDGDQYILTAVWRSLENVIFDTQKKKVIVQRPPGPADCFITLSDSECPYEVHCWAKTGSLPTILTCYQNNQDLVKVQNITDNGSTTRAIFLLPDTTHFSCCSHGITSTVAAATCNDFEWPPGYSGIPSTDITTSRTMFVGEQSNWPTDPRPKTNTHDTVGSGACSPIMIPSQWHFLYLLIYLLVFVVDFVCQ